MGVLQQVFWIVILLGVMIVVHELGHFWAALAVGVKVETFSIGFGPRLLGFKRNDTDFRLSAIPFGGYVRMLGEQPGEHATVDPQSFQAKARWQRAIVIIAGPLMNVLFAIGIVTGLYMYGFPEEIGTSVPLISAVSPNSAGARAGLQPGDKIVQFGEQQNPNWDYLSTQEAMNANHAMDLVVERHGLRVKLSVTPQMDPKEGIGTIGWKGDEQVEIDGFSANSAAQAAGLKTGDLFVSIAGQPVLSPATVQRVVGESGGRPLPVEVLRGKQTVRLNVTPAKNDDPKLPYKIGVAIGLHAPMQIVKLNLPDAFMQSLRHNERGSLMIFQMLGSIVKQRVSPKALAGPIGMAGMAKEAAQRGPQTFLTMMAFVSLNLAIFNLLPIPILDGGTLLLLIIEMLIQREVSMRIKETALKLGFVFLMMVVVFVLYNDISKKLAG